MFYVLVQKFAEIDLVLCRSANSPCTAKNSWLILIIRVYSLSKLKYFWPIWRRLCLNETTLNRRHLLVRVYTFGAFFKYDLILLSYSQTLIKHF
jgi:hypothetical protein